MMDAHIGFRQPDGSYHNVPYAMREQRGDLPQPDRRGRGVPVVLVVLGVLAAFLVLHRA